MAPRTQQFCCYHSPFFSPFCVSALCSRWVELFVTWPHSIICRHILSLLGLKPRAQFHSNLMSLLRHITR